MFVRKKHNKSGSTSVQIVDKPNGKYRVFRTVGSSSDKTEIERLFRKAKSELDGVLHKDQLSLFRFSDEHDELVKDFVSTLKNGSIRTVGPELIFGTLFDRVGFDAIDEPLFRHLVVARLVYPLSKLKTVDYLYRYQGKTISEDAVYKFLDRFVTRHKEAAEQIAFSYTRRTVRNISVVFYDMTTLYFETEDEDDLRKTGFSKDGKFQKPQIMLGLLVAENGYPIGYDIFEGNTFEGHTLLPFLKQMQKRFRLSKPIVVADAALLSNKNIDGLCLNGYSFIIGGRIKNESHEMRKDILKKSRGMRDGGNFSVKKTGCHRLIIHYSEKRAKKDAHNREKGINKLRKRLKTGSLTKENINNRGYNKFLLLEGQVQLSIDEQKILEDKKWDGLKGYMTNTNLRAKTVIENYHHLWRIEKAFRISKTDLRIRPVYHYRKRRIEAHICIAFVAYTLWKELERLLEKQKLKMTPKRAAELVQNMYAIEYDLPRSAQKQQTVLQMEPEQQKLLDTVFIS